MQTLVIDAQNFIAGASTNNNIADAGYSPASKGVNPYFEKGVLHWQPFKQQITYTGGTVVASIANEADSASLAFIVTSAREFYTLDSYTTTTFRAQDTGNTYASNRTDMAFFNTSLFVTSNVDIVKWSPTAPGTIDLRWWTSTKSKTALTNGRKHPLIVIEDTLYIGDGNKIHTLDTADTIVTSAMIFPAELEINTFVPHPNGRDLIVFASLIKTSGQTYKSKNVAYIVNTLTLEYSSEIPLEDLVTSAKLVSGIVYVTYSNNLGYFTDTGLNFLKKLDTTYTNNITKNKVSSMSSDYLLAIDEKILSITNMGGGKVFNYPFTEAAGVNIFNLLNLGDNVLFYATSSAIYNLQYATDADNADSPLFYTNKYTLPARAWIRKVEVEHTPYVSGAGLKLYTVDENNTATDQGSYTYTTNGAVGHSRWDMNVFTSIAQVALQAVKTSGASIGVKKITIFYELGDEI